MEELADREEGIVPKGRSPLKPRSLAGGDCRFYRRFRSEQEDAGKI